MRLRIYLSNGAVGYREVGVQPVAHAPVIEIVEILQAAAVYEGPDWRLHGPVNVILAWVSSPGLV